uniref:Major capsid protein n=1 Tax=Pithovirus LCPAC001 TaxID=2506585 RepID=A0A481Z1Z5_9VIRU|nr:MAG: hypothetical protein LCPAC001_02310 [Pithovirus LCPAC001]
MAEYKHVGFKPSSRYGSGTITAKDNHFYFETEVEFNFPDNSVQVSAGRFPDTIPATYDASFTQNIIHNPEEYKFTIARLFLKGDGIPLMNLANERFNLALSFDDGGGEKSYPRVLTSFTPSTLIFTLGEFIDTFNKAMNNAFIDISAGVALPAGVTKSPQLVWNPDTRQISIYCQSAYNSSISGNNRVGIWICQNLVHLFSVWEYVTGQYNIILPAPQPVTPAPPPILPPNVFLSIPFSEIKVQDLGWNRLQWRYGIERPGIPNPDIIDTYPLPLIEQLIGVGPVSDPPHDSIRIPQQQGNFLNSISQLAGFIITSNSLNARKESISKVFRNSDPSLGLALNQTITASQYSQQSVIFDLAMPEPGNVATENIVYSPFVYRWVDLTGNAPLNRLQFTINFLFKDGTFLPLEIGRGSYASIKFLFQSVNKKHDNNIIG